MSIAKLWGNKASRIFQTIFVFLLVLVWIFSAWPQIWNNPPFPPKIQEGQAVTCNTPTFGTNGGSFNNDTSSTMSVTGGCSKICYTTDGSTPGASTAGTCNASPTQTYSTAVAVTATGTVLKAIATKSGSTNSSVATSNAFTLTVANPSFGTNGGSFNNDTTSTQTSTTTGAVFCQTVDGTTTPAATSGTCTTGTTGANATVIATGKTIKVIGTKANYVNSAVQTSNAFTLTVADPTFGTNGGSFNNDTTSTQTSATTGAVFCQTVDGTTTPVATSGTCTTGTTGANATVIATGKTIKVIGTKANYVNSAVVTSSTFTLTVGAITSSPGAGTYSTGTQSVTLSIATTTSAVAHYTTDGTAVSCSSTTYAGAFNVLTTTTVKAIGCKTNYVDDAAISDLYTITPVATPAYDNGTATYNNDVSVTITVATPASSVICYTTDGSTPGASTPGTCDSSPTQTYSTAVAITATGTVLKAIGTKANYPNSAVQSATYTLTVGAITSSPGAGTYTSAKSVTLSIATTTSAVAHYTTDGSAVSCSSTTYSGAFNISTTSTVKAIGCKTNYVDDAAISDLYTINYIISVQISDGVVTYGTVVQGASKNTLVGDLNDKQNAMNDGTAAENFNIKGQNGTGGGCTWTLSSAAGSNNYMHESSTNGGTNWVPLTTSYVTMYTGVALSATPTFDLRLTVPTTSTCFGQQNVDVTIQAVQQ